jgi:hypothetical protein
MEEESRSMGMKESRKQRALLDRLGAHLPNLEHLQPLQFYSINQYSFHACLCALCFCVCVCYIARARQHPTTNLGVFLQEHHCGHAHALQTQVAAAVLPAPQ